jgi:hypothetical protein
MPERIYQCSDGHLYSADWLKALVLSIHFGFGTHYQRCPVDGRWRMAKQVRPDQMTPTQLNEARRYRF